MRQGHPGGGKDSGHHDGEVNRKGGRPLTKALRLLYLPYKWLIFVPLLVLSTCFFVGIGIVIIFIFNDRTANRTAGVRWARFNSFITPMIMTVISSEERGLSWIDGTGIAVWCVGFIFESMGDFQLDQFIKNPTNRGKIIRSGLWRYSRHPNYFGEAPLWWDMGIIALSSPWGWAGLIGPLVITMMILFVSGVPMTERMMEDVTGWEEYKRSTSAFFPWFPKTPRARD